MELETIISSKITQTKKDKHYFNSFVVVIFESLDKFRMPIEVRK